MELHFEYYVVEFLHQPYLNIETYVCVPYSWIKVNAYGTTDRRVAVAYPAEAWRHTQRYVKEKRSPRRKWAHYCALLRFGTDDYKEANKYIRQKNSNDNKKRKLRKRKRRVIRSSKKSVTSRTEILDCQKKELRVTVTRTSLLEYRLKRKEPDKSKSTLNRKRPTVIKTAKALNETSDLNKSLEKQNKLQLSEENKLTQNIETDYTISKTQNKCISGLHTQLAHPLNDLNQANPPQVLNNSSDAKPQETVIEQANENIGGHKILRNSESYLKYQSTVSTPKAFSKCDESLKYFRKIKPDLEKPVLIPYCPLIGMCQNSMCQSSCSCENIEKHYLPQRHNNILHHHLNWQNQHEQRSIGYQNYPDRSYLSSDTSNKLNKERFLSEPHLKQTLHENNIGFPKSTDCAKNHSVKYLSKLVTTDNLSGIQSRYNVTNMSSELFNDRHKNNYLTVNERNIHKEVCTPEMNYKRPIVLYCREEENCANNINVSSTGTDLSISPNKSSLVLVSSYGKQDSLNNLNNTLQNFPCADTLSMAINHDNVKTSISRNNITELNCLKSTVQNTLVTENSSQLSSQLIRKQLPYSYVNHSYQGLIPRQSNVQTNLHKEINKEKYIGLQTCSQHTTLRLPHISEQQIMYDSNKIIRNNPICQTEFPKPSDYFKQFPFHYKKHNQTAIIPQDRLEMATAGDNVDNSIAQILSSQNKIETVFDHEMKYPQKATKDRLMKEGNFYILPSKTNNNPHAQYNCPNGLNHTTQVPKMLHQIKQQACTLNTNTTVSQVSNNYVVDDPRNVIIKKVIKVKPMEKRDLPSIIMNDTPTTDQTRGFLSVVNDQTNQISKKRDRIPHPPNYANELIQKVSLQHIHSAEINKCNASDKQIRNRNASVLDISKDDNMIIGKVCNQNLIEDIIEDNFTNTTYNTPVSKYNPLSTNQPSPLFSQSTPVASNNTLKNLLLQEISYKRQGKLSGNIINNYFNNNNTEISLQNEINKTEKHLTCSEGKQSKKDEQQHSSNSNDSKTIKITFTTDKRTNDQGTTIKSSDIDQNIQSKNKHYSENDVICVSDDNDDYCKTAQHDKVKLRLPPEFKPHNSKWTLKHQKATPGVVEIIPGSRVYVDEIGLNHCITQAKNYNVLARRLLLEIFSLNALNVCSLTGAKNNNNDSRPSLDEGARSTMLEYIEEHGRANGWDPMNANTVLSSLRSKIHEIRGKFESRQ